MSRSRPKIGPSLNFATLISTRSTRARAAQDTQEPAVLPQGEASASQAVASGSRPARTAKTKANTNAIWQGAAPTGPKPKDPGPVEPASTESTSTGRKRAASKTQEGRDPKARKKAMPDATRSETKASGKQKAPAQIQSKAVTPPEEFFDDDNAESDVDDEMHGQDAGEGAAESQDMGYDDDDDLAALNAAGNSEGLQDALRQERPHWSATSSTSDDEGMEAEPRFYRSSSRASGSSGRMTIPPSEDDDSDDEDPETKAGFSALKAAQRAVPEPDKKEMPKASSSRSLSTPPIAARSKREISRDQERPTWKRGADMEQPTRPSSSTIRARSVHGGRPLQQPVPKRSRPVKLEPQDNFIALSGSSSEIINIDSDSDDDGVQVIEPSDIDVVVRTDGKVGLKQQRPRVEKTVQLAVDFFLSYYLFLAFFPTSEEKTVFTLDALVNAAHTHNFDDIKKRLLADSNYVGLCPRCLLAPMLHGRVSNFRLKAKTAADAIVVSDYDLKINIEARVMFLLEGMRYIHVLVPGAIDPKTGRPGADVIQKDTAFMAGGIKTTLMNAFFKGSPSLAQKYSNLFETGVNGRKKMPRCMVAAGATAVHTSLNEYRTGYHIKTTFDGNHLHEIYETHLLLIDTLVAANSTLLEDLYTSLTQGSRLAAVAGRPIAKEALALLGL